MSNQFWLSEDQFVRIEPYFRCPMGCLALMIPFGQICYANRLTGKGCNTPQSTSHGPHSAQRGDIRRAIGRTKGGLNSKLHAVCDGLGRPVRLLLTEGQQSDRMGAATLLPDLAPAKGLIAGQRIR